MTVLNYKVLVFCLFNVILTYAQEGRWCASPTGASGTCINIRQCNYIINILVQQGTTPEVANFLRRSACGWAGDDPLVCCPSTQATTETSRTPTPSRNIFGVIIPPDSTSPNTQRPLTQRPNTPRPNPVWPLTQEPIVTRAPITRAPVTQAPVTQAPVTQAPITRAPITQRPNTQRTLEPNTAESSYPNILRPPFCGKSNAQTSRIVNGAPALPGEYPWIVALGYRNSKNPSQPKWLCGGSMISDRHILTAGHCVHNRPDLYLARVGELDLYDDDDQAQPTTHNLARAKIHENYNPSTFTNDIAILTLAERHNNPTVNPICLPFEESMKTKNYTSKRLAVAGWGALYFNGPSSPTLQAVNLPVVSNEVCSRAFASVKTATIDERVICAGYLQGGKDACQGDSGGPLMEGKVEGRNSTFYQIGLVSYGFRCAEQGYPGVYTRISSFIDWIDRQLI